MLGGSSVPAAMVRWVEPSGPAVNVTNITPKMYGSDFAFVFIDTDGNQSTGFYVGGAEVAISIQGKGNEILSARVHKLNGSTWQDAGIASAAIDQYQLEVAANHSELGLTPGKVYTITYFVQDWRGVQDEIVASMLARTTAGLTAFGGVMLNELYSRAPPSGLNDWFELYNTGSEAVDLSGWTFSANGVVMYTFPAGTIIQPGGFVVVQNLDLSKSTSFVLRDSTGTSVDQVSIPFWKETSYGRIGNPPYGTWSDMVPTPGAINNGQYPIPEFGDIIMPISIIIIIFGVIRRVKRAENSSPPIED
jgi:hypothetical protein